MKVKYRDSDGEIILIGSSKEDLPCAAGESCATYKGSFLPARIRDYKFVNGVGYEGIWGQRAALDTQDVPRGYVVVETAYEHPGLAVPEMPIA